MLKRAERDALATSALALRAVAEAHLALVEVLLEHSGIEEENPSTSEEESARDEEDDSEKFSRSALPHFLGERD